MRLDEYLEQRGESVRQFSERSGVSRATLANVLHREHACRIDIAWQIVSASRDQPAGRRGTVDWIDLIP